MRRTPEPLSRVDRVGIVGAIAMGLLFAAVLARIAQLQLAPGRTLAAYAENRVATRPVQGYRGEILDRRGRLLSTSRLGYRVFVDPEQIDRARIDELIVQLADVTGEPADRVGERIVRAVSLNDSRRQLRPEELPEHKSFLQAVSALWGDDASEVAAAAPPETDGPTIIEDELTLDAPPDASESALSGAATEEAGQSLPPLLRYVAIGGVLSDEQVARARGLGQPGVHLERRPVREYPGGDMVASLVGKVGFENSGLLGAELALDDRLTASDGTARYVRDASGRPLWIERGQWTPASHGHSQRLSIDLELQRIAHEELWRGVEHADAAGGLLLMLDPLTGEVLAMVDIYRDVGELPEFPWVDIKPDPNAPKPPAYNPGAPTRYRTLTLDPGRAIHPALGRNRCVEDIYEPGSTFKPFVWSLVTESGLAKPEEVFDTEGGRWLMRVGRSARMIEDVTRRAEMTWTEVLINSSNIGMIKGATRMEFDALRSGILRFGFGARTGIGLSGESAGMVTPASRWSHWTQESVAHGNEISVTPIQIARAYCAFARSGALAGTIPTVSLLATGPNAAARDALVKVLPPEVATMARHALRQVAANAERNMTQVDPAETGWRYQMFGKSGTAEIPLGKPPKGKRRPPGASGYFDNQYNSSFIAGAPLENPRLLLVVVINDPGPEAIRARRHYGSWVAAPVARRVLERSLTYLGVSPDAPEERADEALQTASSR
ncbi:MAG TPA: penicillin-binding protein 2 [Phycisphaerales bacterium]|nr:penicillin-binding protein 2 [Phycisphaerales bacterium]